MRQDHSPRSKSSEKRKECTTTTCRIQTLQNSKVGLTKPLLGTYLWRKEGESPKETFMNFYTTLCWLLLGPYSTENSEAERLEFGTAKVFMVLPSLSSHTKLPSVPSRKELTFYTDWPLTQNRELIHQRLYIIGNNLGQTKTCGPGVREYTSIFPEDSTVPPRKNQESRPPEHTRWNSHKEC